MARAVNIEVLLFLYPHLLAWYLANDRGSVNTDLIELHFLKSLMYYL